MKKSISYEMLFRFRRRSTFPGSCPPSIIDVKELNFRVRDGNGCDLLAIATGSSIFDRHSKLNNTKKCSKDFGQALGLLVSISYMHYCTSTFDLSTM